MRRVLQALEQRAITATKAEVDLLISDASISIQAYIEDNANLTDLKQSIEELNKASSTLQIMQIHGGVLLLDETVKVIQMLVDGTASRVEEAQDVVSRSIIRLTEYLEHVEAGNKDVPLALMPLLNDLRAARDSALLSENVLFFPNIEGVKPPEIIVQTNEKADESWLRVIRSNFQKTLLACVSGKDIPTAAAQLCKLSIRLQRASKIETGQKLWWLASALAQSVAINALPFNASIASLFNALDKQIKLLIEIGEEKFSTQVDENIVKNILYYIAISDNRGRIVNQVKELYKLNEQIPQQQEMDELRQKISSPSSEVLITVSKALLEDLASAKDCIELFIHSDLQEQKHIDRLYSGLQRISDTLSMIGIEDYKTKAEHQIHEVELLKSGEQGDVELALLGISEVILEIETCINNFIEYRINFKEPANIEEANKARFFNNQSDNERKAAFSVTISEVLLRVEQTKELLTDVVHIEYDQDKVGRCIQNMHDLRGVISVIDLTAPVELIDGIASYINSEKFKQDISSDGDALLDLADCVVGLQCYFEQLESRVPYAEQILEYCEHALDRIVNPVHAEDILEEEQKLENIQVENDVDLDLDISEMSEDDNSLLDIQAASKISQDAMSGLPYVDDDIDSISELPDLNDIADNIPESDKQSKNTNVDENADEVHDNNVIVSSEPAIQQEMVQESESEQNKFESDKDSINIDVDAAENGLIKDSKTEFAVLTGEADPILVETFIEEAEQVVIDIKSSWQAWNNDQNDWESFAIMRRGYHTLKGSGRFVGAELLSEFGWQLENLCNKCLGKKEPIAEFKQQILQQAVESAPALVKQLNNPEQPNSVDAFALIEHAKNAAADINNVNTPIPVNQKPEKQELPSNDQLSKVDSGDQQDTNLKDTKNVDQPDNLALQDELTGIFAKEATQHLKVMREALVEDKSDTDEIKIGEDLLRTVHTMRGSARTAGVKHISDLCEPLEEIVALVIKHNIQFTNEQTSLVRSCVKQIESDLAKIERAEAIDELDRELIVQLQQLNENLVGEYCVEENQSHEHADESAPQVHTDLVNHPDTVTDIEMVDAAEHRDEELCEIFYEEAEDILSQCQASFQKLKSKELLDAAVSELQRQFHTLKGSSRMAGLTTIGELSHVTESLLIAIANKNVETSLAISLLQKVLDQLYANIESAQRQQDIYLNNDLIAELKEASGSVQLESDNVSGQTNNKSSYEKSSEEKLQDINEMVLSEGSVEVGLVDSEQSREQESVFELKELDENQDSQQTESQNDSEITNTSLKKFINVSSNVESEPSKAQDKHEVVRVPADVLDGLVNDAGEVNIQRSRLEQMFNLFTSNSGELEQTIGRLREQLRKLDIETEAQILFKHADDQENIADFDPLELDRYSDIQQLSRSLAESVDDLSNIREMFLKNIQDAEDVLISQKVVTTNLQDGLLHTRMIRFDSVEARLQRIVRQTSNELNKQVDLVLEGGDIEIDRRVLNGVIASIEHILRNSVGHGIEEPAKREELNKPKRGQIKIEIVREGSEISITLKDDGAGIDPEKVKAKAIENGFLSASTEISDEDALQLILKSGLSTANAVTKIAGRGVGMDIVDKDVRRMGGNIEIRSVLNKGAKFILKLPFTLAVSHSLLVRAGKQVYALTLSGVEGVIQLDSTELKEIYSDTNPGYTYAGHDYSFHHLASLLKTGGFSVNDDNKVYPVILIRMGDQRIALQVDATFGNKEIVVKPMAPHFSQSQGISGATILGDGSVALILDAPWIVRLLQAQTGNDAVVMTYTSDDESDEEATIMVVDDSITIRKVTTRFLEKNNYKVVTAKDGVDALQKLQNVTPDIVLLDIEMPRMDGYELATQMRKESRLTSVPIIMITSRTGEKHRNRAMELGVNCYLGKPYNEAQLLESINSF